MEPIETLAGANDEMAVAREYAAAREGAALADLSDRGVLRVAGPLRQKFLQGILSNDVASLRPGEGCLAALMNVKGHLLAFLRVLVTDGAVFLELPRDRISLVLDTLQHYRVAAPVTFAEVPTAVMALLGPRSQEVLSAAGVDRGKTLVFPAEDLPVEGLVIHTEPENAASLWQSLCESGASPLGRPALDALRIESGEAWYGDDVSEDNLLHETGVLQKYHSSTKGCYVGQEVVARLEARGGHVSRQLRGLRLAAPVPRGARVRLSGKDVGQVTSSAVSPRLGPVALAYIHRTAFEPGTTLEVEGVAATVVAPPFE
jgi:folate-binding protein YgfZ